MLHEQADERTERKSNADSPCDGLAVGWPLGHLCSVQKVRPERAGPSSSMSSSVNSIGPRDFLISISEKSSFFSSLFTNQRHVYPPRGRFPITVMSGPPDFRTTISPASNSLISMLSLVFDMNEVGTSDSRRKESDS